MSDLRINIQGLNDRNTLQDREYPKLDDQTTLIPATGGARSSERTRLLFEPAATKTLFRHISWGKRYRPGDVEQAGMLLGNYYRDRTRRKELIWGNVVAVIPAHEGLVTATFDNIDISAEAWSRMYEEAAEYLERGGQILGWYHTHLDSIGTRFSALDRSTQKKSFTFEYSFAAVFNPNQMRWSVFYGPDSTECKGVLMVDGDIYEGRDISPKINIKQVNGDSLLNEDGTVAHLDEDGNPIPVRHREKDGRTEGAREGATTFRSLVGDFFSGLGELVSGNTKEPDSRKRRRAEMPGASRQKEINCDFYAFSSEGRLVQQPGFGLTMTIDQELMDELEGLMSFGRTKGLSIDGKLFQKENRIVLTAASVEMANSRIVFGRNLEKGEDLRKTVRKLQNTCDPRVSYLVIIDEIGNRRADVRAVYLDGGNAR